MVTKLGPSRDGADAELRVRRGLLVVLAVAALTAVLGGLARLGVALAWGPRYSPDHGPLFVLGVFAAVIALERAVALGRAWGLVAPAIGAIAVAAMLVGRGPAGWLAAASSLALVLLNLAIVRRQAAHFTWLMLLGSATLLVGAVSWAIGRPIFEIVSTWMGFFVLTIVAERLELSRLAPTPRWASRAVVVLAIVLALACVADLLGWRPAARGVGSAMALLGAWQLRFDLARRTLRVSGLPRFAAVGVLLGAGWLVAGGGLVAAIGLPSAGPRYDAALHAVFVGFVLSMVFAHAPIILPAVARVEVPFTRVLYLPLAVLHLGLTARIVGDLAGAARLREFGGLMNGAALVLFALAVFLARHRSRPGAPRDRVLAP